MNKIFLELMFSVVRILTFFFCSIVFTPVFAQGNQPEYLEAKRQYNLGNYRDAMRSFQQLTNDSVFGVYSTFYFALSTYNQGASKVASDAWKQILIKYPLWDQRAEVNYWIAKTSFEQKNYADGFKYASYLSEDIGSSLLNPVKDELGSEALDKLYNTYPDNKLLANLYFQVLSRQPYDDRDHETLRTIAQKFDLGFAEVASNFPLVKKKKYAVALVLPFMFDSLPNPQSVIRNKIILELYQGMKLAQDALFEMEISLELYPFDTRKAEHNMQQLVTNGILDNADLIVGPLYANPNKIISAYSKEKGIPMINPLSSNGDIIEDNRVAYLFKPSYETQGRKAGEYAAQKFSSNKNAMILFETERDQILAEAYKKVLESDSFNIVLYDQLTRKYALQIRAMFTKKYKNVLGSLSQKEADSIAFLPNRHVRSRVIRDGKTGRIVKDENGETKLEYYEMKFIMPEDTIGHMFIATSSNLLVNSFISLAEAREDGIGIIGYDDWLKFKLVSFSQLERLGVSLIHASYADGQNLVEVENKVRTTFMTEPTEYHHIGYELIMQLGLLFDKYGKYFQKGFIADEYLDGHVMEGLSYGPYRDNQVVPIVTIEDLVLKIQNRKGTNEN